MTLIISTAKLTGRALKAAITKFLAYQKEAMARASPDVQPKGKQTVKELVGQNQGVANIEINDKNIKAGSTAPLLIVLVLAMAGGGAVYFFKFRKPKTDTKGSVDLDDYDFGEDEDYEYEKDDADEPEACGEGD